MRLAIVMALLVVACGGTGQDATTTSPAATDTSTTTTVADTTSTSQATSTPVSNDDFCGFLVEFGDGFSEQLNVLAMEPEEIERLYRDNLDAIDRAVTLAPAELRSDVEMFTVAFGGMVDVLDEFDFNFMAIPEGFEDDPRIQALDDPALEEAGQRIEEYCGIDDFVTASPSSTPEDGGVTVAGDTELPEGFPAEMVPPGVDAFVAASMAGTNSVTFDTSTAVDDVIAHYTDVLGPPLQELDDPKGAVWASTFGGEFLNIVVAKVGDDRSEVNVTYGG